MKLLPLALAASLFALPAQATLNLSTHPTKNMDCSGGVCVATDANAVLNVDDLAAMLATADVRVETDGESFQDIEIIAPLAWASSHALTLHANDAIFVRRPITVEGTAHLTFDVGGGPIFQQRGAVRFWDVASALTIEGDDYVLVNSVQGLAAAVAANPRGSFALANDYNARQDGVYSRDPVPTFFQGTFDGLGNTIANLSISDTADSYVALFLATGHLSTLRNLGLANVEIEGHSTFSNEVVASLAGFNNGRVIDCHATGTVGAEIVGTAGGLLGGNGGSVYRVWANVAVTGAQGGDAGGLIGFTDKGIVSDSYALGRVTGGDFGEAGGLIGSNRGRVRSSYSTGAVVGGQSTTIGGAYGSSTPKSKNVYWDTETSGTAIAVGMGSSEGVTGLTTAELQAGLLDGFEPGIWGQNPTTNGGLPYLLTNLPR
jgi:hypothetical protein